MNKTKLLLLGWNETNLKERMQGCRDGIREVDGDKESAWTYRFLFVSLYLKYKNWLAIIRN